MKWLKEETNSFPKNMIEKNINPRMEKVMLDYTFFSEENYRGIESHREAAVKTIEVLNSKRLSASKKIIYTDNIYFHDPNSLDVFEMPRDKPYAVNLELMNAKQITTKIFFGANDVPNTVDTRIYQDAFLKIPFWKHQEAEDFKKINNYLFPQKENLIVYQWDNDWSNYFSAGKDGCAASMWTVYDPESNKFTVVSISLSL